MLVLVRPGEYFLKSERTRRFFEQILIKNIKRALPDCEVELERGRLFVRTGSRKALRCLAKLPGISSVSPVLEAKPEVDDIARKSIRMLRRKLKEGMSFAVRTRVVGQHPFSSRYINERVGDAIKRAKNVTVDLESPDLLLEIEVRGQKAYLSCRRLQGVGGLPVGAEGRVISLCRGRPEDLLSTWFALKRGCDTVLLILHECPDRFLKRFRRLGVPMKAYFVRTRKCPRSVALRLAGDLGKAEGACAVILSDRLDQLDEDVISLDGFCGLPVLRPLVGFTEEDIRKLLQRFGLRRVSSRQTKPNQVPRAEVEVLASKLRAELQQTLLYP